MYHKLILLVAFVLFLQLNRATAQTDPCSLAAILSSFEAAALSDSVDLWSQQYSSRDCPDNVNRSARTLVRAYQEYVSKDIAVSIPRNWGRGTGIRHSDSQSYWNVNLEITTIENGEFTGLFSFDSPLGHILAAVEGKYFNDVDISSESEPYDSVIVADECTTDEIYAWLTWSPVETLNNANYNLERLYISAITLTGKMCLVTLETPAGGNLITTWNLTEITEP